MTLKMSIDDGFGVRDPFSQVMETER
jgi:hypothetical protein